MRRSIFDIVAQKEGKPLKQLMQELYERHGSQTKVAAAIGASQSRVSQIIKGLGLREKTILVEESEVDKACCHWENEGVHHDHPTGRNRAGSVGD